MARLVLSLLLIGAGPAAAAEPDPLVTIKAGTIPLILSAPHGGREAIANVKPRQGEGVAQFATVRDDNTAELAEQLAVQIEKRLGGRPYLVLARFERKYVDANRAENAAVESDLAKPYYRAYHRAIEEFAEDLQKKWKRGLLLDIHGQGGIPNALVRGTNNGQTTELLTKRHGRDALIGPKSLLGRFASMGFPIVPGVASEDDEDKRYLGGYIVRTYGSHQGHGIDAIQLEFGSDLRKKAALPKTASAMAEALEHFAREFMPEMLDVKKPR